MAVTTRRPKDLPDFRKPPLTETVLSLQFEPLPGMMSPHVGLLWQKFRKELPLIEHHAPLQPVLEKFGPPSPSPVEVTFEEQLPPPRILVP